MTGQFILGEQYVRIQCDLKDENGELQYDFYIEARKNLSIAEQRALTERLQELNDQASDIIDEQLDAADAIDSEREALMKRPDDLDVSAAWKPNRAEIRSNARKSRDLQTSTAKQLQAIDQEKRELITPYIRAWNLAVQDEHGATTPVPPPREGGLDVLEQASPDLLNWMISKCAVAYRLGKALSSGKKSDASPEPTPEPSNVGPQVGSTSNSRRSRK